MKGTWNYGKYCELKIYCDIKKHVVMILSIKPFIIPGIYKPVYKELVKYVLYLIKSLLNIKRWTQNTISGQKQVDFTCIWDF